MIQEDVVHVVSVGVFLILQCCVYLQNIAGYKALGGFGGWVSQNFWTWAHEGGTIVSPTHRPPLPPGDIPGTPFC
jgi:hypothetical protein